MLDKKLKILYIHQYFCVPNGSGGIRSYKNALALKNCGYSVTVLCINDGRNSIGNILKKKSIFGSVGFFEGIKIKEYNIKYSNYMSLFERSIVFTRFFIQSSFEALFLGPFYFLYLNS